MFWVDTCTNTSSVCDVGYLHGSRIARDYGALSSQVLQAASENGELTYVNVTYSSATPCPAVPSKPFQTTIRIVCDYDTQFEIIRAAPWVDVVHTGSCSALIEAASKHACPLNKDLCKFTLHDSPGRTAVYELSSLSTDRLTVYEAFGSPNSPFNSSLVLFNICAPVLLPFTTSGDCDSDTAGCLLSTPNTRLLAGEAGHIRTVSLPSGVTRGAQDMTSEGLVFERLGLQSSLDVEKHPDGVEGGVVLVYGNGSRCGSETYTLRVQLDCVPSCHPPGLCLKPQGGGDFSLFNPPCGFLIIAGSSAACPEIIGTPLSYGSLVSIVLLSVVVGGFVLYCLLGTLVNLSRGRRDSSVVPNRDSWVKLFSYVRGGGRALIRVFNRLVGCGGPLSVGSVNVGLSGDSDAGLGAEGSGAASAGLYGTL